MFEPGRICRFERIDYDDKCLTAKDVREYVTPDGTLLPEVLIEEQCRTESISDGGYYRVLEVLGEKKVLNEYGGILRYDVDLRLEKAADYCWTYEVEAEDFFKELENAGFYFRHETVEKYNQDSVTEWFAVWSERGVIVFSENYSTMLGKVNVIIFKPSLETMRSLMYPSLKTLCRKPYNPLADLYDDKKSAGGVPDYIEFSDLAPDIIETIKRQNIRGDVKCRKHYPFEMPFVDGFHYEWPMYNGFGISGTTDISHEEYLAYFEKCRKIFDSFPDDVQSFLKNYTDVSVRYLEGEPWKIIEEKIQEKHKNYEEGKYDIWKPFG